MLTLFPVIIIIIISLQLQTHESISFPLFKVVICVDNRQTLKAVHEPTHRELFHCGVSGILYE